MKKIKCAHIIENLNTGGLEKVLESIARNLDSNRFELNIYCIVSGGKIAKKLINDGFHVKILNIPNYRNPLNFFKLANILKKDKIVLVHTHGYFAAVMGITAAKIAKIKTKIIHIHTSDYNLKGKNILVNKFIINCATKIIFVSNKSLKTFINNNHTDASKSLVIHNGIPDIKVHLEPSQTKELIITCVASLYEHKNHATLFKAMAIVTKSYPNAKLWLVGKGPLLNKLEQLASTLKITDNITFWGEQDNVEELLNKTTIFALSSNREGLPISIIEAMSHGIPVVATTVGGNSELVIDTITGFLVEPNNEETLATKLIDLLNNASLRKEMGDNARKAFLVKYQAKHMVSNIESLYTSCTPIHENSSKTNRHNILYTSDFGQLSGGGQQSTLLILKNLNINKYNIFLNCNESGNLLEETQKLKVRNNIITLPSINFFNIFSIIKALSLIKHFLLENHIDIIHTESSRATFYYGIAAKRLKIPVIYHVRVSMPDPMIYEKFLYNLSTKIIAVSKSASNRFTSLKNSKNKVEIIYNAVNTHIFSPNNQNKNFRKKYNLGNDLVVGLVGQLTSFKGQDDLLLAASKVTPQMKNIKFVMVGNEINGYQSHLEHRVKELNLSNHVIILNYNKNITEIMSNFDILVNASKYEGKHGGEGFSRVIIEAMSLGKAIIATDVGGNSEAIKNNHSGLLVPPNDPDSLAQALNTLAKDKDKRIKLGNSARAQALKEFDINKQIEQIENCYAGILSKC